MRLSGQPPDLGLATKSAAPPEAVRDLNPEFDQYAHQYSDLLADPLRDSFGKLFLHQRKLLLIREFLRQRGVETRRSTWVDIGCGRGDLLRLGAPEFELATGCDVSSAMLEGCEGLDVRRQQKDDVLPFADGFADLATAVCVYHHIALDKRAALTREAARILKPGGYFCIIEHNPINPITRMIVNRSPVDADAHLLRSGETRCLLEAQALRVQAVRHFLFFPEFLFSRIGFLEEGLAWAPIGGQYAVFARAV